MLRCALLDDYQNVAQKIAGNSPLKGRVARRCSMKGWARRTLSPPAVRHRLPDARAHRLPARCDRGSTNLKLVVTAGMRNAAIDLAALKERGISLRHQDMRASRPPILLS